MCDVEGDVATCAGRNTHGRSQEELKKLYRDWEETPNHMNTLDVRSLLQVRRFCLLGVVPICTTRDIGAVSYTHLTLPTNREV